MGNWNGYQCMLFYCFLSCFVMFFFSSVTSSNAAGTPSPSAFLRLGGATTRRIARRGKTKRTANRLLATPVNSTATMEDVFLMSGTAMVTMVRSRAWIWFHFNNASSSIMLSWLRGGGALWNSFACFHINALKWASEEKSFIDQMLALCSGFKIIIMKKLLGAPRGPHF